MSRGRRSTSLEALQREFAARTGDAEVAALVGLPAVATPPDRVTRPARPRRTPDWAYRQAPDFLYRTAVEDLRDEAEEAIELEVPEWAPWVRFARSGQVDEIPRQYREQLVATWDVLMAQLIATMPKPAGRKRQTKRMPPRVMGESSPCVTRRPDGSVTCDGEDVSDVAGSLLRHFDPHKPDPEWLGRR